jgi:hypothetical protein
MPSRVGFSKLKPILNRCVEPFEPGCWQPVRCRPYTSRLHLRFGQWPPRLGIDNLLRRLLSTVGDCLHFLIRPKYHTPVEVKNDWIDRIGAFWLVSCAFDPSLDGYLFLRFH